MAQTFFADDFVQQNMQPGTWWKGGCFPCWCLLSKGFEMHKSWKRNKDENEVVVVCVLRFVCRSSWFPLLCLCIPPIWPIYMFVYDLMYLTSNILIVGVRARGSFPLSPSIEVLSLNLSLASYVFIMRVANNPSSIGGIQHLVDTEWCFHGFHGGVKGRAIFRLNSIFRTLEPQTTSDQRLLLQKANLVHQQVVVSSVNFINWNLPIHTSMYLASLGRFASAICDVPYALRGCFERSCHHESPIVLAKWE